MITIINMRTNDSVMMNYDGPYLIYDVDFGKITSSMSMTSFYKQKGSKINAVKWGTRDVVLMGNIIPDENGTLKEKRDFIERMVNLDDDIKVIYDGKYIIGKPKSTINFGKTEKENNQFWCKFSIELLCPNPLFRSVQKKVYDLSNWQNNLEFPLEVPLDNVVNPAAKYPAGVEFEIISENTVKEIVVDGDIACPVQIEFIVNGIVVNPFFVNVNTQEMVKMLGEYQVGDRIYVDTTYSQQSIKLLRNDVYTNIFVQRDKASTLDMELTVGTNNVLSGADDGDMFLNTVVRFDDLYLGVLWQC